MFHVEQRTAEVPEAAVRLFGDRLDLAVAYWESLVSEGQKRGLIGPREVPKLWERHILNCGVLQELVPEGAVVADIGSGAGLPGIPLAIARPDVKVILIESMLRRTTYLSEFIASVDLDIRVVRGRAEDRAVVAEVGQCDVVTSRAVAALPLLMSLSMPLLRPGGLMLALKGSTAAQEIVDSAREARKYGAVDLAVRECGAGFVDELTVVIEARKIDAPTRRTSRR
ncbi:16S rRNA (guanine(527)-N(7))-methyltransferase RsmG [Smaragdicoccus niigatensis]|uniref:16S rRNA (guanine(527)-N(7))-methyltransferase RsmG n=1 Tax=Smaragdicoccus niigatensis TaxID=359359 RepID=UPI00037C65AB|nr:16S rRNA (guanine(527)-N(7))-methyltransferase RsmG [Smaragdicoccus niigatensis]